MLPLNYMWSLNPIAGKDYDYVRDGFCLPSNPPPTMQLGDHNRAMVCSWRPSGTLASVTVEALSLEVWGSWAARSVCESLALTKQRWTMSTTAAG